MTRPLGDNVTVTLTAALSKGSAATNKEFSLTVLAADLTDEELVGAIRDTLVIGYILRDRSNAVTRNVTLTNAGPGGVAITWTSDRTGVIATDGMVTRPTMDGGNTAVTLTATLSKGSAATNKEFSLTVLATGVVHFIDQFGSEGNGPGQFQNALGIAVDEAHIYVMDNGKHDVQIFDKATGAYVTQFGSEGNGDGQFLDPFGIAVDDDSIYVTDRGPG